MRRYELKQKRRDVATCNAPKAHMLGDQAKQKRTGVVEDVQMSEAVVLAAIRFFNDAGVRWLVKMSSKFAICRSDVSTRRCNLRRAASPYAR